MSLQPLKSQIFSFGSEWYEVSDEYDASVTGFTGNVEYYGYLNSSGKWIIQQHNISTGAYRYTMGTSSYATAWALAIAGNLSGFVYYNALSSGSVP